MKKFLTRRGSQFVSSIIAAAMLLLLMSAFAACDWSGNDNPEEQAEVYYSDFGAIGDGVVDDFDSMIDIMAETKPFPKFAGIITGPSRTADIECVSTVGVHGPRQYAVIVVEDE